METNNISQNALLSEANYADFNDALKSDGSYDKDLVIDVLIGNGDDLTSTQAEEIPIHRVGPT